LPPSSAGPRAYIDITTVRRMTMAARLNPYTLRVSYIPLTLLLMISFLGAMLLLTAKQYVIGAFLCCSQRVSYGKILCS
jgi:hypothetical protein